VIGGAIALLAVSLASILLLGMEFLPEADEGLFTVEFETRVASSYAETAAKAAQIEGIVRDVAGDEVQAIASEVGEGGSQFGRIYVTLTDVRDRRVAIWDVVNAVNDRIAESVTDVQYDIGIQGMSSLASTAGGVSFPVVIELTGRNLENLAAYAEELTDVVAGVPGTRNVSSSYQSGKPELQFRIDRDQAAALGLSAFEIASTIRTAYSGTSVSRYSQANESYDVVVILEPEDRTSLAGVQDLFFVNRAGARIPLENVVTLEEDTGPVRISRMDRTRVVRVQGALTGERALSNVMDDVRSRIDELHSPPVGIDLAYAGSTSEMEDSFESMIYALLLAVALVYMVMASQFESLLNPLIVMFSVPFAVIGLVAALLVTNTTFNILAFVGAILLAGIVVNNAIVLIDYIGTLRRKGFTLENAIVTGGITRLKPILMTSLTTILGLLPMALGIGVGSEIQAPLGRAVVGGLATSTLITLILIPTIYWVIERPRKTYQEAC
jgi:HAE1 family hydrophobic/amphiphilic exporter-1